MTLLLQSGPYKITFIRQSLTLECSLSKHLEHFDSKSHELVIEHGEDMYPYRTHRVRNVEYTPCIRIKGRCCSIAVFNGLDFFFLTVTVDCPSLIRFFMFFFTHLTVPKSIAVW